MINQAETMNINERFTLLKQGLREKAIYEIAFEDNNFKECLYDALTLSTYNKINQKKTTLENLEKEGELKAELAGYLKKYKTKIENMVNEMLFKLIS